MATLLDRLARGVNRLGSFRDSDWYFAQNFTGARPTTSGVSVTADTALTLAAVYRAISVLAETTSSLPLQLFRRKSEGERERAAAHPAQRPARPSQPGDERHGVPGIHDDPARRPRQRLRRGSVGPGRPGRQPARHALADPHLPGQAQALRRLRRQVLRRDHSGRRPSYPRRRGGPAPQGQGGPPRGQGTHHSGPRIDRRRPGRRTLCSCPARQRQLRPRVSSSSSGSRTRTSSNSSVPTGGRTTAEPRTPARSASSGARTPTGWRRRSATSTPSTWSPGSST